MSRIGTDVDLPPRSEVVPKPGKHVPVPELREQPVSVVPPDGPCAVTSHDQEDAGLRLSVRIVDLWILYLTYRRVSSRESMVKAPGVIQQFLSITH